MGFGVIILAGGRSSRMGADKAVLDWGGRRAVDRLADLAGGLGSAMVVTAGPVAYGLPFVADDPPGGGPVAGIAAASVLLARAGCARALVLAVDAPTVAREDLAPLLAAPGPGACYAGLHLPLAIDLAALPADAGAGWSMFRLIETAGIARLDCPDGALARLRGANTPEEREILLAGLPTADPAQKGGAG